jgi:hypothetical protein
MTVFALDEVVARKFAGVATSPELAACRTIYSPKANHKVVVGLGRGERAKRNLAFSFRLSGPTNFPLSLLLKRKPLSRSSAISGLQLKLRQLAIDIRFPVVH